MKNTKKKAMSTSEFNPQKEDIVLLDTNILIRLFTPYNIGSYNNYDKLWSKLIKCKSKLIISSIQISEFINRCIRIEFDLYKKSKGLDKIDYKKDYRSTQEYMDKMEDILEIVKEDISKNFSFIDDGFSKINPENIFKQKFSYDFNDALIVEIAKQYNAILVTDDGDYANYKLDLPVVTSNRILLSMR